MKKLVSVLLIAMIVISGGIGAFAEDPAGTQVTINDGNNSGEVTYNGYRLFTSVHTQKEEGGETKNYYVYTLNDKYTQIILDAVNDPAVGEKELIDYLGTLEDRDLQDVAGKIFALLDENEVEPDAVLTAGTAQELPEGYWLFAEASEPDENVTKAFILVDTVGKEELQINVKNDAVTCVKKVYDGDELADATIHAMGETASFVITGTLSGELDYYDTFNYVITDTIQNTLAFQEETLVISLDGTPLENPEEGDPIYTVTTDADTKEEDDPLTLVIAFNDVKVLEGITSSSVFTVEYDCILTEDAVYYNSNEAFITAGDGEVKTPKDKVTVFTLTLIVNKVDNKNNPLPGAGFTLYMLDEETGEYVKLCDELIGTEEEPMTTFTFPGLSAGKYKLEESTIPDKYKKVSDIYFEVVPVYETESDDPQMTDLQVVDEDGEILQSFTVDLSTGVMETTVVNGRLPDTGGAESIFFYLIGILFIAAGVFVITRKKARA